MQRRASCSSWIDVQKAAAFMLGWTSRPRENLPHLVGHCCTIGCRPELMLAGCRRVRGDARSLALTFHSDPDAGGLLTRGPSALRCSQAQGRCRASQQLLRPAAGGSGGAAGFSRILACAGRTVAFLQDPGLAQAKR